MGGRAQLPAVTPGRGRGPSAYSIEKHTLLPNVVLLRGQGPFEVKYVAASGGSLKEVVVSRKCGEAVLRGANVWDSYYLYTNLQCSNIFLLVNAFLSDTCSLPHQT